MTQTYNGKTNALVHYNFAQTMHLSDPLPW